MRMKSGLILLLIVVITSGCIHTTQTQPQNQSNITPQTQNPSQNNGVAGTKDANSLDNRFDGYDPVAYDSENFSLIVYKDTDAYDLLTTGRANLSKIVSSNPRYSSKDEAAMGILKPMCQRVQRKSFESGSTNQVPAYQKLTFKVSTTAGKTIKKSHTIKMTTVRDYLETHRPIHIGISLLDISTGKTKAKCSINGKVERGLKITVQ